MNPTRDQALVRRLLGDLPGIEGNLREDEAWNRLQTTLAVERSGSSRVWLWTLGGLSLAGVLALLIAPKPAAPSGVPQTVVAERASAPPPASEVAHPRTLPSTDPLRAKLRGEGVIRDGQGTEPTLLAGEETAAVGATLSTAKGELRIELPDGSSALLERGSNLRIAQLTPGATELALDSGALFVHAARQRTGAFVVRAGAYRVIVRGTGFRVERRAGHLTVGLWHGSVELRADGDGAGRFLSPGQRLLLSEGRPVSQARLSTLGRLAGRGAVEEDRLLHLPVRRPTHRPAMAALPAAVGADVARRRESLPALGPGAPLRLDLSLSNDGQVLSAAAERGATDPRLASCVAEAALHWRLDPPPAGLRGMQFVYAVPLE